MKELCFSVGPINVYFGGLDRWAVTLMHYCTRARWEAGCRDRDRVLAQRIPR